MKTILSTALLTIAMSFPAHAREDVSISDVADLPVTSVKTFHSVAGEGMDAFVKRIAPEFTLYTQTTGHEVCGTIAVKENDGTTDGAFSLVMGTIKSQIACVNGPVEAGYTDIHTSVHSHPQRRQVRLTAVDMKARGTPAGKLRTESLTPCEFSGQDYEGSGYLITCGKVLHQRGRGTEREI